MDVQVGKDLGVKEDFTIKKEDEAISKDDVVILPILPPFKTIHRADFRHYICPFTGGCSVQVTSIDSLKNHYRIHCEKDYKPFYCTFNDSCKYASSKKRFVYNHVRMKHFSKDNVNLDTHGFVGTHNYLLEMEDALFNSAQIVSSPKTQQKRRQYECVFGNCTKKLPSFSCLVDHLRSHTQSKPFKCSCTTDCDYAGTRRQNVQKHILSVHFNIPEKQHKYLSKEEKQRANQYLEIDQDTYDNGEIQVAMAQRLKLSVQRRLSTTDNTTDNTTDVTDHDDTGFETPDYTQVQFDDGTNIFGSSEDEDDKEKLAAFLASLPPSTSH